MSSRLSGKVCITTSTGLSIGRAASRAFAREGALVGCDLTVDTDIVVDGGMKCLVITDGWR
jgi:NAD(P)-dependent dehydrogenase (short-subunit alcohol dehydrogenase family)